MGDKKHSIEINMTQSTSGEADNVTLVQEYSDDSAIHVIKTQVFTDEITSAINRATQRLTSMALEEMGAKSSKK